MTTITEEQLKNILKKFAGHRITEKDSTPYQKITIPFFVDPKKVIDPRVQFTSQLDISEIYSNYEKNYKDAGTTFTAFVKWIAIKSMQNTPFNWRFINKSWYEFHNLPLEVSVCTQDERQQLLYFIDNVDQSNWKNFSSLHAEIAKGTLKDSIDSIKDFPLYALAHEVVGVHIPRMTNYSTSQKVEGLHQPWFVFSDRYSQDGKLYLPVYLSFSHAVLTPRVAEKFLNTFTENAKLLPDAIQKKFISQIKTNHETTVAVPQAITPISEGVTDMFSNLPYNSIVPTFKTKSRRSADDKLYEEAKQFVGNNLPLKRPLKPKKSPYMA